MENYSKLLPRSCSDAFRGLKIQAEYATALIAQGSLTVRNTLAFAHKLMDSNVLEVEFILLALNEQQLTIDDVDEKWLFKTLQDSDNLLLSYLKEKPFYYAACNSINGKDYYFITTYYDDVSTCAGHSENISEAIEIAEKAVNPLIMKYLNRMPAELRFSLQKPHLASNFSFVGGSAD